MNADLAPNFVRQIYECVKNFTHTFRVRLWSKSEGEIFSLWEVCKLGTLHSVGSFIFLSTSLPLSTHATKLDSFSQYRWPLMNDRCFVVCNSQRRGDFFFLSIFYVVDLYRCESCTPCRTLWIRDWFYSLCNDDGKFSRISDQRACGPSAGLPLKIFEYSNGSWHAEFVAIAINGNCVERWC